MFRSGTRENAVAKQFCLFFFGFIFSMAYYHLQLLSIKSLNNYTSIFLVMFILTITTVLPILWPKQGKNFAVVFMLSSAISIFRMGVLAMVWFEMSVTASTNIMDNYASIIESLECDVASFYAAATSKNAFFKMSLPGKAITLKDRALQLYKG